MTKGATALREDAFCHLDQILIEMEAIRDLSGLRRSPSCGSRVITPTIATDKLNLGVCLKPFLGSLRTALRQHIDNLMGMEID